MVTLVLICIVLTFAGWAAYNKIRRPPNYPPGPPGFFSFFQLKKDNEPFISKCIEKLTDKYGKVVGLSVMHRRFVCVTGYEAVFDVLNNTDMDSRVDSFDFNLRTGGLRRGVLMTDGDLWKEQRRFTLRHLKDLGFGKSSLEGIMIDEIHDFIANLQESISSCKTENIKLDNTFCLPVINILFGVIVGKRFERGDPKMELLASCMDGFMRSSTGAPLLNLLPFVRFIAPEWTGYNNLMNQIQPIRDYISEEIAEHRRTRQPEDMPRDFIDVYLQMLDDKQNPPDSTFNDEQLVAIIFDVFVAGSETTSHTLGFALLLMIKYPEAQTRIQAEIDQILHGAPPSMIHRGRLPYTEAALLEIQRRTTVAPITVPHLAACDTQCQGYDVPKDTIMFVDLWSVHMDPNSWPDPYDYKPERHLNPDGTLMRSDRILSFGSGKRSCIGETLARNSLFIFFVAILQHFRFETPIGQIDPTLEPSLEPVPGLTLAPRPCLAKVTKRSFN